MASSLESDAANDPMAAVAPDEETSVAGRIMGAAIRERLFGRGASREPARIGRFVITKCVGEGGMGTVYRALDSDLERWVAVKVFRGGSDDATARARMIREGQAMARVTHPNVVTVFEVGTAELDSVQRVFVAMEFVVGRDLATWAREHPVGTRGRWRRALDLLLQAARGLAAAHSAALIHRDFKPANVLVGDDGRVRVADFGLARNDDSASTPREGEPIPTTLVDRGLTKTGSVWGTPAYMAPEQRSGKRIDARADQFAFCVSAWEVLYGERPPVEGALPDPSAEARVPAWVRNVLRRGLAANADDRFASMNELADALARDPTRARRRAGGIVLGVSAIAVAAFAYLHERSTRCDASGDAVRSAWTDADREALLQAIDTASRGAAAAERLVSTLDAYGAEWMRVSTDVCEAGELRGELGPNELATARACLDDRLTHFRALADVLDEPDPNALPLALKVALRMRPPTACAVPELAQREPPRPDDPEVADQVRAARTDLVRARALRNVGRDEEARRRIGEVLERAHALEYEPLIAEAMVEEGLTAHFLADYEVSRRVLEDAYWRALRAGADATAAEAAGALLRHHAAVGDVDVGLEWYRSAEVLGERAGLEPGERIWLLSSKAHALLDRGDRDAAEATMKEAFDLAVALWGEDDPATVAVLADYGIVLRRNGKPEEAVAAFRRTIEVEERIFGEDWIGLAAVLHNLGNVLDEVGRSDEARSVLERAHALNRSRFGDDHPETISAASALIGLSVDAGELEVAAAGYRAAATRYARAKLPTTQESSITNDLNLAYVLALDAACDDALEVLPSVVERYEAAKGPTSPLSGIARTRLCACRAELEPAADGPAHCEEAVEFWREHHPKHRGRFEAEDAVAREYQRRGDTASALAWLDELEQQRRELDAKPQLANMMQLRALVLSDLGEHDRAIGLSRAALALFEETVTFVPELFLHRVDHLAVLRRAGRDADAEAAAARALELARTRRQRERVTQAGLAHP